MKPLTPHDLERSTTRTLDHYAGTAASFWEGTRGHDVSQNYAALLDALEGSPPFAVLDFGCGPGRDVEYFASLGHDVIGLDGTLPFVEMARQRTGREIWHQNFLALDLPASRFDGIFANASLFHVPKQELGRVLGALHESLKPRGVLFSSNPRGADTEGFSGERYAAFHSFETWRDVVTEAGFTEIQHYYRPEGKPRAEQPWLASVFRKR